SGTNALSLIIQGLNIKNEIVTTPNSFVATANTVINNNNTPVYADISLTDGNIDPSQVKAAISDKTSAILPVHLHGNPVKFDEIDDLVSSREIPIIEDACQAHGAYYKNRKVGSLGEAAAFSFYSTKNMTVGGDGGMITTNNQNFAEWAISMRDTGRINGKKYEHNLVGVTSRLNTINAAIGRIQLRDLDNYNARRIEIAQKYNKAFDSENLITLKVDSENVAVYHLYPVLIENRDLFFNKMASLGIECGLNYPLSIPDQPFNSNQDHIRGTWKNSKIWTSKVVCLPMHANLTNSEVKYIIDSTLDVIHDL
ncbi:MAG: DegT/DnrJ/EryC1/StrS family aminotransferase, partial [Candidatus Heimdallarchaeota archaeon]|nr:DegT/DnrJ/EryC1/StrS family aminotransferase [Candidatus Heimdallarchaeota archaeon]